MASKTKFRIGDLNTRKFVQDEWLGLSIGCDGYISRFGNPTVNLVLYQYIGLNDKNGQEIYEGDFVIEGDGPPALINYNKTYAAFFAYGHSINIPGVSSCFSKDLQVVGNVLENPEILHL